MLIKHALIAAFVTILLIMAAGLGVAKYRHTMTLESWLQYVWLISIAIGYIGFLCRGGAARGAELNATGKVLYVS